MTVIKQLDIRENLEFRTLNALSAVRLKLGEAQEEEVQLKEELTDLRRSVSGILTYVEAAPDALGDLVTEELRIIEGRVNGATMRSWRTYVNVCSLLREVIHRSVIRRDVKLFSLNSSVSLCVIFSIN